MNGFSLPSIFARLTGGGGRPRRGGILPGPRSSLKNGSSIVAATNASPFQKPILLLTVILILTVVVFAPVLGFEFVFDDNVYVTENPFLRQGLTPESVRWAFTSTYAAFWHPLTWLSHLLDVELYGFAPWGHHLTSLLIHLATTALLFLVFSAMTGDMVRSAFVTTLFAIHPLHVESVAWVSERKDVLSGLFWVLTMAAYLRYARRPSAGRYLLVAAAYGAGLTAKPMLVTLPFALLLLDLWPLGRTTGFLSVPAPGRGRFPTMSLGRLILEKIPFMLPIPLLSRISYQAQVEYRAVSARLQYPLEIRLGNAVFSYGRYLAKTFWPAKMSSFYPHPGYDLPLGLTILSGVVLVAVTVAAVLLWRRLAAVTVGWFWFLGTLVPVIGIVQLGKMAMADRYTYLPLIGIFVAVAWGVPQLFHRPALGRWLAAGGGIVLAVLVPLSVIQVGYWRDGVTLFSHAIAVTDNNSLAHYNLGEALQRRGRIEEARREYWKTLEINPRYFEAHNNLGNLAAAAGHLDEAVSHYREVLRIVPRDANGHYNLGVALMGGPNHAEAIDHLRQAVALKQDFPEGYNNLGVALAMSGETNGAIEAFREALRLDPDNLDARENLKRALAEKR